MGPSVDTIKRAVVSGAIIRGLKIEAFQQAVRQVAHEQVKTANERERREEARREALKKKGVLYGDGSIPGQPEDGDCFFHQDWVRGSIKLPPEIALPPEPPRHPEYPSLEKSRPESWNEKDKNKLAAYREEIARYEENMRAFPAKLDRVILPFFKYVKQQGFPVEKEGSRYVLNVCAWLPVEPHYKDPPPYKSLLPVPRGELADVEKITILAAIHNALSHGAKKIAPWGESEDKEGPDPWPKDAGKGERKAALAYCELCWKAENINDANLSTAWSWLEDLTANGGALQKEPAAEPPDAAGDDATPENVRQVAGTQDTVKFTCTEAAGYVGVDQSTMRRWIKDGKIEVESIGGTAYQFRRSVLDAHKMAQEAKKAKSKAKG